MTMRSLFGLVCLVYPREFRHRYFAQIVGDYEQHEREFAGGAAYLLRMLCDVLLSGLALRFDMLARDVSTALRRLRQSPLLVVIMVLTFALGIGANITVFSVLNAVLLQPLPYANAPRLVAIRIENPRTGGAYHDTFSLPDLWDFRTRTTTLQNATGFTEGQRTLTGYGRPVALNNLYMTWRFFDTLGVKPELGRFATPPASEQRFNTRVVISDALWRGRFHAAPDIIGRTIMLDGIASRVIAVTPPGFQSPEPYEIGFFRTDVWTYLPETAPQHRRGWRYLFAIGLLRPGVSLDAARADLARVQRQLAIQYPGRSDPHGDLRQRRGCRALDHLRGRHRRVLDYVRECRKFAAHADQCADARTDDADGTGRIPCTHHETAAHRVGCARGARRHRRRRHCVPRAA
jgi:hypothetical protein